MIPAQDMMDACGAMEEECIAAVMHEVRKGLALTLTPALTLTLTRYARCTKIASRPAPLYYAHLAAAHAPWYETNDPNPYPKGYPKPKPNPNYSPYANPNPNPNPTPNQV